MKALCIAFLLIGLSVSAISQKTMIVYKHDGTKIFYQLSNIDSLTFPNTQMVDVEGGTFTAGRTLTTIKNFKIDKFEVTFEKWDEVRNWALGHGYSDLGKGQNSAYPFGVNYPVVNMSWYDAVKWCNARSEMEDLIPVYYTSNTLTTVYRTGSGDSFNLLPDCVKWAGNGYRLPTEVEWLYAAMGGNLSQGYYYSGSNTIDEVAWYNGNSAIEGIFCARGVGTKKSNELGIYDMSGNVSEWCWDWYLFEFPTGGTTDPKGPSTVQMHRVIRGGSFFSADNYCSPYVRVYYVYEKGTGHWDVGFRCARD